MKAFIVFLFVGMCVMTAVPAATSGGSAHEDNSPAASIMGFPVTVQKAPSGGGGAQPAPQVLPWGVDRIDAELAANTGAGVDIAVIDTGIDSDHPDLKANIAGGVAFVNSRVRSAYAWEDDNGHGTHVAGTVGAVNNQQGVVGVAPGARLWAVKVLDSRGSGSLNNVVLGIQWAIDNKMDVITMSLASTADYQPLHDACDRAYNAGIVVVAAAGNNGGAVSYPAAYDSVIAVSATDSANVLATFSNRGSQVDISAPGVAVYSTYKGNTYSTLSGTSMACPHVTGAVALVLASPVGASDADLDGVWDPAEVSAKLYAGSEDLGAPGWDALYGAGLVDAQAASA